MGEKQGRGEEEGRVDSREENEELFIGGRAKVKARKRNDGRGMERTRREGKSAGRKKYRARGNRQVHTHRNVTFPPYAHQ